MKKLLILVVAFALCGVANAQSNWEKPADNTQQERRGLLDRNKTKVIDKKYLVGGVPEIDGKVVWAKKIDVKGKTASQIYDTLLPFFQSFVKGEEQLKTSQVAVVNKETHQIGVRAQEWLTFENKALSLDRTKMYYTIIAQCSNGLADIKIQNISYRYEEDRPSGFNMTAEEWITDANALNKKQTGFQKGGVKKFRMKTIDRMDDILTQIEAALK